MTKAQKSMAGGVAILSIAGLVCKIVGALYRVPLSHIIGEEGMATYQLVFPTYNLLLTISSAGFPAAISQMVSACLAKDDAISAKRVFKAAFWLLLAVGFLGTLLMIVFSPQLAAYTKDPATQPGFVAIAPALLLVCLLSAYRGFLQGQHDMVPTAVSQLIEQVGKVAICLPLSYFGMKISVAYAAAGMLLGTSIAEAVALVYMVIMKRKNQEHFQTLEQKIEQDSSWNPFWQLLIVSIPVTLGSCIVPLSGFIDSGMVLRRLTESAGVAMNVAKPLYGAYSGYVLTLINVPTAIATALCTSLVPSISQAYSVGNEKQLHTHAIQGLRISFLIGLPCSLGMSLLSREILSLIYHFSSLEILDQTAAIYSLSSFTILFFTLVQSTTGILTGLRKQNIPMYTLLGGVTVKIVLNYVLIGTPGIGLKGAPIASICCYGLSTVVNLFFSVKYIRFRFDWANLLLKPAAATAMMGVVILLLKNMLPSAHWATILMIAAAMAVFFVSAVLLKAITREDLRPVLRAKHSKQ